MSAANKELILSVMRANGRADALDLRNRATGADGSAPMDGTAVIAEEHKIPAWSAEKDYSGWAAGAPVRYNGQVYALLQPHNAAYYPGSTPENTAALWSIRHTKDAAKAKAWAAPAGTSGLYMAEECCVWDGAVYRCLQDNNPYSPEDYPDWWEITA